MVPTANTVRNAMNTKRKIAAGFKRNFLEERTKETMNLKGSSVMQPFLSLHPESTYTQSEFRNSRSLQDFAKRKYSTDSFNKYLLSAYHVSALRHREL